MQIITISASVLAINEFSIKRTNSFDIRPKVPKENVEFWIKVPKISSKLQENSVSLPEVWDIKQTSKSQHSSRDKKKHPNFFGLCLHDLHLRSVAQPFYELIRWGVHYNQHPNPAPLLPHPLFAWWSKPLLLLILWHNRVCPGLNFFIHSSP